LLDYNFLEDAKLKTDRLERTRKSENIDDHPFQFHPNHVKFVQRRIHERLIHMQLMPQGMSRRERNTTHYKSKEEKVYWRMEFVFPQLENQTPFQIDEINVMEDITLQDVLLQYLDANATCVTGSAQGESATITNAPIRNKLELYVNKLIEYRTSTDDKSGHPFSLFMLAEKKPASASNALLYYQLDGTKSIRDALVDKIVVEFPIIQVVLPEDFDKYSIITEDQIQETLKELRDRIQERKEKKKLFQDRQEQYEQKMQEKQQQQKEMHKNNDYGGHSSRGGYQQRGRGRGAGFHPRGRGRGYNAERQ
jgi:hypothetical protein